MIVREIDWRNPYSAFAPFSGEPHAHFLHGGDQSVAAEWSIIVAFQQSVLSSTEGAHDFAALAALAQERQIEMTDACGRFPFVSGLVGYVGYDAARFIDPALAMPPSPFALPDMVFGVYEAAALFSRTTRSAFVVGRNLAACRRLEGALGKDDAAAPDKMISADLLATVSSREYQKTIAGVVEDIRNGDYYQANISHQIHARIRGNTDALSAYRKLASNSDASFGGVLQYPEADILSNSPERFFRIDPRTNGSRYIVSEPIKGTRPRSDDTDRDKALATELVNDPKERAENIMIADLIRNDLSLVCEDGSIREEAICELASFSTVHHLVSRISGALRNDVTIGDVFEALFPCGSVTGAPKIAAMNAIASAEGLGRGPYCGAIGYIDDRGKADLAVAIRTVIVSSEQEQLTIPVGGGVTLRSNPDFEYKETLTKAGAALEAFGLSVQASS